MSALSYRTATNADFADIVRLWNKSFGHFGTTSETAEVLFYDLGTRTDVALCNGRVVGIAMVRIHGQWAELACIAVASPFHGHGVSEILLKRCHEYCERKCLRGISLHTVEKESRAQSFFRKNGYNVVEGRLQYPNGQWACRMAVKLS